MKRIEMNFLPDVSVPCELCGGERFTPETLAVAWGGRHIGEVLRMSVDEALDFFSAHPKIHHALELMRAVGLSYLTLGQPTQGALPGIGQERESCLCGLCSDQPGDGEETIIKVDHLYLTAVDRTFLSSTFSSQTR